MESVQNKKDQYMDSDKIELIQQGMLYQSCKFNSLNSKNDPINHQSGKMKHRKVHSTYDLREISINHQNLS